MPLREDDIGHQTHHATAYAVVAPYAPIGHEKHEKTQKTGVVF